MKKIQKHKIKTIKIPEFKVKDKVKLWSGDSGIVVKIKNIPWGGKYIVKIIKPIPYEKNELIDFLPEHLKLEKNKYY